MEGLLEGSSGKKTTEEEMREVVRAMRELLQRIEEAVPFISLAVTTSGVSISSQIPHSVSPSRLLQASTFLTAGDTAYGANPFDPAQIGTTFTLTLYMLFGAHTHRQDISAKDLTWQETFSKCRVKLQRVPLFYETDTSSDRHMRARHKTDEFCYELVVIEDLDDGRMHDTKRSKFEDVKHAGLIVRIPVHQITKMFYTTSGKLLGIEDSTSPILLIKRDIKATPPRRIIERAESYNYEEDPESDSEPNFPLELGEGDNRRVAAPPSSPPGPEQHNSFPPHLNSSWLAFEVYNSPLNNNDDDDDDVTPPSSRTVSPSSSPPDMQHLSLATPQLPRHQVAQRTTSQDRSSLSILECLLRLTNLQNFKQASHLVVNDELLNMFLDGSFDDPVKVAENQEERVRVASESSAASSRFARGLVDSGLPPMTPSTQGSRTRRVRQVREVEEVEDEWTPDRQLGGEWRESSPIAARRR